MGKLNHKIAIVTGAASGIGKAIAERYVAEGAKVVIADIDFEKAEKTAAIMGANAHAVHFDVTDESSIANLVTSAETHFGQIDILVNNAAIFNLAPLTEITREQYHQVFSVNVEGLLFTMQAVANHMIAHNLSLIHI